MSRANWQWFLVVACLVAGGCGKAADEQGVKPGAVTPAPAPSGASAGMTLVAEKNCMAICHKAGNVLKAPLLEEAMRARRARMADYATHIERLKVQDAPRYEQFKDKIDAIVAEQDPERRLRLWLNAYLEKTTFDDAANKMLDVNPKLTPEEIDRLSAYLAELGAKR